MKKRNIIIISISTISLVFGGLVFLGVSTFPELLEEEKKEIEHSHEEVLFNAPSNDNKKNDDAVIVTSSSGSSKYVVEANKSFKTSSHMLSNGSYQIINHESSATISVKEQPVSNKEIVTNIESTAKTPSSYYKGKSYVSIKKEREAKDLTIKEKLNRSEIIETRNKNIVNTIVLVVVAIEALAFIILNKKRHSHKA